jgi:hypothetical protein
MVVLIHQLVHKISQSTMRIRIRTEIFLTLAVLIISFVVSKPALAADIYSAQGNNGVIYSTVEMLPGNTFKPGDPFKVTGSILSLSTTTESVGMTATNMGETTGPAVTLIPQQNIDPDRTISSGLVSGFTAPSTLGKYAINFVTNVDIPTIITGKLVYRCLNWKTGRDYHQGDGNITLTLDKPSSKNLTFTYASCDDGAGQYNFNCQGVSIIPGGLPSGYVDLHNGPWSFTIPAGSTQYVSPTPWWDDIHKNSSYSCQNNGNKDTRTTYVQKAYLRLVSPDPVPTLQFTGVSYQKNDTYPVSMPVVQVP